MSELYIGNVNLKGCYNEEQDLESIRRRVTAHGSTCHKDREESGNYGDYYGTLWSDAKNLLDLLDEANEKIKSLEEPKAGKSDFVLNVTVGLDGEKIARAVQAFNREMGQ